MVKIRKIEHEEATTITGLRDLSNIHDIKKMSTTPKWNNLLLNSKNKLQDEATEIINSMNNSKLLPDALELINIFITNSTREERIYSYREQVKKLYNEYKLLDESKEHLNVTNLNQFEQTLFLKYNWTPEASTQIHTETATIFLPIDLILNEKIFNGSFNSGTRIMDTGVPQEHIETNIGTFNEKSNLKTYLTFILAHEIGHSILNPHLKNRKIG